MSSIVKEQYYNYDLSGFYNKDIWDLELNSRFKNTFKDKATGLQHSLRFDNIDNSTIKNELKYIFKDFLENTNSTFKTIKTHNMLLVPFIKYLSNNTLNSLLDLDKNSYIQWLDNNGYKTTRPQYYISSKIEKEKKEIECQYIKNIVFLQNQLNNLLNLKDFKPEQNKDIWDIRKLDIKVEISKSNPIYTINFTRIKSYTLKQVVKKFSYNQLKSKNIRTVRNNLNVIFHFCEWIYLNYNYISNFNELERKHIEEYFGYLRTCEYAYDSVQKRIEILKYFFDVIQLLDPDNAPLKTLIFNNDSNRRVKTLPKFYTDEELSNINRYINDLPIQIGRMLFVIENVGMRISELCILEKDCLKQNKDNEYNLTYFMPKTNKWNTVPINDIVAETIKSAIKYSQENFGIECKYVFSKNLNNPITSDIFNLQLKKLSLKNNIVGSDGKLLNITSHRFRGTVATKYANLGLDLNVIKLMLGQKNIGVLKHYISIHDITMIDVMKPIIDERENLINNIGNIEQVQINELENKQKTIPLPNGCCVKDASTGKCKHANACYTCRMFKPSKQFLTLYKQQLKESELNIEIAKVNGYERILEMNTELKINLEKIIKTIENKE